MTYSELLSRIRTAWQDCQNNANYAHLFFEEAGTITEFENFIDSCKINFMHDLTDNLESKFNLSLTFVFVGRNWETLLIDTWREPKDNAFSESNAGLTNLHGVAKEKSAAKILKILQSLNSQARTFIRELPADWDTFCLDVGLKRNPARCSQCESLVINGVGSHEAGRPIAWQDKTRECKECGQTFIPEHKRQVCCSDHCHRIYNGMACDCDLCLELAQEEDENETV